MGRRNKMVGDICFSPTKDPWEEKTRHKHEV